MCAARGREVVEARFQLEQASDAALAVVAGVARREPSPGRITQYHVAGGPGIRYDSHVYANYYVPPHYDSLVGKLLAYGDTREQAIARMRVALSEMVIEGIQTNIPLHQELMNDAAFIRGGVSIHYLEEKIAALKSI